MNFYFSGGFRKLFRRRIQLTSGDVIDSCPHVSIKRRPSFSSLAIRILCGEVIKLNRDYVAERSGLHVMPLKDEVDKV